MGTDDTFDGWDMVVFGMVLELLWSACMLKLRLLSLLTWRRACYARVLNQGWGFSGWLDKPELPRPLS